MKNLLTIALCLLLTGANLGCATVRRHPVATAIIGAAVVGGTVAVIQNRHNSCPNTYDGRPYQGTAPCPK